MYLTAKYILPVIVYTMLCNTTLNTNISSCVGCNYLCRLDPVCVFCIPLGKDIQNLCEQHNKEVEASAVVLQHKIEEKDEEWEKNLIASQETWDKAAKGQCQDVVTQSTELFSQFNVTLQERLDALQQRILLANQHIQKTR